MKPCILLIEDDQDMRDLVSGHLEHSGFDVQRADDGIKGQALALQYTPDLILLDLMLPKVDGLTLCQRLRRDDRTAGIPILMLTALGGTKDKVSGFNSGADDYLTKPFDLEELQVRVKALLRRSDRAPVGTSNHNEILSYGPLTLVPERFEAIWFDQPVRLTHLEFELLHCLLQRHGHYRVSNRQHRALFDAISAGDEDAAVAALREDIGSAYEVILATLQEGKDG